MFTSSTRQFGNWRRGHASRLRAVPGARVSLLVALACCAAIAWLLFLVCLKIRVAFLPIESAPIALLKLPAADLDQRRARPASFRVAAFGAEQEGVRLVFDDGHAFSWPEEKDTLLEHAQRRLDELELTELLVKGTGERLRRIQVWPARNVTLTRLRDLAGDLSSLGLDEFDIAAEAIPGGNEARAAEGGAH